MHLLTHAAHKAAIARLSYHKSFFFSAFYGFAALYESVTAFSVFLNGSKSADMPFLALSASPLLHYVNTCRRGQSGFCANVYAGSMITFVLTGVRE
jgi:hypothetical protein